MERTNHTTGTEFVLLGLSQVRDVQLFLFTIFLLFYVFILPGNILIIFTVRNDPRLGSPMYLLPTNLAFMDICYCSVTPPKMLADFFSRHKVISYGGCIAQIFFLHFLGAAEIFLLMIMAYDRYVAICQPLRYTTLVNRRICWTLLGAAYAGGFTHSIVQIAIIIRLPFCGPNELDNFFCDVPQLIKLACTDTYLVELLMLSNSGMVTLMCFIFLLISYAILLVKVKTGSNPGKSKAVSTCITHIIIVFIMFTPAIYIYARPFRPFPLDKVVSVFLTVVFPLMNPMIYTLRNKEIKQAMWRWLKHLLLSFQAYL
uniref:Olfactory receptor n=1 Tax=Sphenodon punctatus TaxID=8508 RepID=A0A8D0L1H8_SPHPU